jgi:phage-related holin
MPQTLLSIYATCQATFLKVLFTCGLTAAFYILFGGSYAAIEALFILVVIDFITGLTKCVRTQCKITSRGMGATATKMLKYLLLIVAAHQLNRISPLFTWVETFIALYCGITEFLSVVENLSQAGIIIPKWVVDKLQHYLDTGEFSADQLNSPNPPTV